MSNKLYSCKSCKVKAECRYTFAALWETKSNGGVGCNYRIKPDIAQVRRAMRMAANLKAAEKTQAVQTEVDF